jgi:hypothetical protein
MAVAGVLLTVGDYRCALHRAPSQSGNSQSNVTPTRVFSRRVTRAVRLRPESSSSLKLSGIPCILGTIKRAPVVDKFTIEHVTILRLPMRIFPTTDVRRLSDRRRSMPVVLADWRLPNVG